MNERQSKIAALCDGVRTSREIAKELSDSIKYVQKTALKFDLPRRKRGSAFGKLNGSYKSGRRIDRDGYVLVSAPQGHPYSRKRKDRNTGVIYEHRLVMEKKIGRYLDPLEVVDHVDDLRMHNDADNLRLFSCNAEHLKKTITGQIPDWSEEGLSVMAERRNQKQVNNYDRMKKCGDARLIQILLVALKLGIDSPYLLGSCHHLKKAEISDFSHSNLQHVLVLLCVKWGLSRVLSRL